MTTSPKSIPPTRLCQYVDHRPNVLQPPSGHPLYIRTCGGHWASAGSAKKCRNSSCYARWIFSRATPTRSPTHIETRPHTLTWHTSPLRYPKQHGPKISRYPRTRSLLTYQYQRGASTGRALGRTIVSRACTRASVGETSMR